MDGKEIKVRLIKLGKKQKDLVFALRERGFTVDSSSLSACLNELRVAPWTQRLLMESHKVLMEWESQENYNRNSRL